MAKWQGQRSGKDSEVASFLDWEDTSAREAAADLPGAARVSSSKLLSTRRQPRDFWRGSLFCSSFAHLAAVVFLLTEGAFRHPLEPEIVYSISFEGGKSLGGIEKIDESKKIPEKNRLPDPAQPDQPPPEPESKDPESKDLEAISLNAKPTPLPTPIPQKKQASKPTPQPTTKPTTKPTPQPTAKPKVVPTKEPSLTDLNKALEAATKKYLGNSSKAGGQGIGAAKVTGGNDTGGGVVKPKEFFTYRRDLEAHVKRGWRWFDPNAPLRAQIAFEISPTGEISGIRILTGSGDDRFDQSVIRAVNKANPVPVPPENVYQDFKSVRMTFEPQN